jgi:lipopolysaccharide/colanic/teichoic acid biosynthesis glycosyltransferase
LSPLLLLIAVAVKLTDGGSVLYRQKRVGLNGTSFVMFKFRTMHEDAEHGLGPVWSAPADPRCTKIGGLLRRLGLDELPQLWNILRGEMSLVGPRPERPEFVQQFSKSLPGYNYRHSLRSGLTGFAQVHGWRGDTSIEERLRHDLFYVEHWSLLLDIKVILLTFVHGWSQRTRALTGSRVRK